MQGTKSGESSTVLDHLERQRAVGSHALLGGRLERRSLGAQLCGQLCQHGVRELAQPRSQPTGRHVVGAFSGERERGPSEGPGRKERTITVRLDAPHARLHSQSISTLDSRGESCASS